MTFENNEIFTVSPRKKKRSSLQNESSEVNLFTKYSLFISNFILTVSGLALGALSVWLLVEKSQQVYDSINVIIDVSIFLCVAGFITAIVSSLGCWGALRENTIFIAIYKNVLLVLVLSEVILMFLVILYTTLPDVRKSFNLFPRDSFWDSMLKYADDNIKNDNMRYFVDNIHLSLQCCGLSSSNMGYKDWEKIPEFRCQNSTGTILSCSVPTTCCKINPGDQVNVFCGRGVLGLNIIEANKKIYTQGCLQAFNEWVNKNGFIIAAVLIAIAIPQIVLFYLGNCLVDQIYRQKAKWFE